MRKFVLIAAMLLASASVQAGESRGLTLASNDDPTPLAQPTAVDAAKPSEPLKPLDAPKYAERPSLDTTPSPAQPKADRLRRKADARAAALIAKKRRQASTKARVISALHRYGIYW